MTSGLNERIRGLLTYMRYTNRRILYFTCIHRSTQDWSLELHVAPIKHIPVCNPRPSQIHIHIQIMWCQQSNSCIAMHWLFSQLKTDKRISCSTYLNVSIFQVAEPEGLKALINSKHGFHTVHKALKRSLQLRDLIGQSHVLYYLQQQAHDFYHTSDCN